MPKYIIERTVPGASALHPEELQEIAKRSNAAIAELGEPYNWITSYVAGDKLYCIHEADSAEVVMRHSKGGRFPVDLVSEIKTDIGPKTAFGFPRVA